MVPLQIEGTPHLAREGSVACYDGVGTPLPSYAMSSTDLRFAATRSGAGYCCTAVTTAVI
eukprot:1219865-Rhodomonas_salina.1